MAAQLPRNVVGGLRLKLNSKMAVLRIQILQPHSFDREHRKLLRLSMIYLFMQKYCNRIVLIGNIGNNKFNDISIYVGDILVKIHIRRHKTKITDRFILNHQNIRREILRI